MGKNAPAAAEAPKKRMTAYFLFQKEMREITKTENPGLKLTDLAKKMGEKWRALTTEEKTDYAERAKKM